MKRINIAVDMDDNEILTKSIQDAITDQAKQTAREQFQKVLALEIERIVEAKLKQAKDSHYYSEMGKKIGDLVSQKIAREIPVLTSEVNQAIEKKIADYLDKAISSKGGMDKFLQNYIDRSIANALVQRANANR